VKQKANLAPKTIKTLYALNTALLCLLIAKLLSKNTFRPYKYTSTDKSRYGRFRPKIMHDHYLERTF